MSQRIVKPAILCLLLSFGAFHFGRMVWFSPQFEFLPPSFQADWMMHPEDCERIPLGPTPSELSEQVLFQRTFDLDQVPETAWIELKAMTRYHLTINGALAGETDSNKSWKRPQRHALNEYLLPGKNNIEITVWNPTGVAALLVKGDVADVALKTRPDTGWLARKPDDQSWRKCVAAGTNVDDLPFTTKRMAVASFYGILLIGGILALVGYPRLRQDVGNSGRGPQQRDLNGKTFWTAVGLIFAALFILNLHNASSYPYEQGIDSLGHAEYVRYMAKELSVPLATDGWEMFQPPVYYALSGLLYSALQSPPLSLSDPACLRGIQVFGALLGLANIAIVFLSLLLLFPGKRYIQLLGLLFCGFLPMQLYMSPLITNEVAAGAAASLCLYMGLRYLLAEQVSLSQFVLLGIMIGIGLMTKHTALFAGISLAAVFALRAWRRRDRREIAGILLMVTVAACFSGWFYVRNIANFDDPFVGNWDLQSTFHYEQRPGYRTAEYFLKLGEAPYNPNRWDNLWNSFWDGQYATMWADAQALFVNLDSRRQRYGMHLVLVLAVVPTLAMIAGFWRSLRSAYRRPTGNPDTALSLITVLTLVSVVHFAIEVPFFSTVKAFFFLSLMVPITVFAVQGLRMMLHNLGRFRWILYSIMIAISLLNYMTYWY